MKKVLLASTALVLSAGIAAAEVSVGGDGRMGIRQLADGADDLLFSSRIRISFSASGETDAGLAFGGSIRADNAVGGAAGTAGNVFVEGTFGKLSMGDVDGAAQQATGHVSGVGYTGLGDLHESTFITGGQDPTALYEYSTGDLSFYLSAGQQETIDDELAVGVSYGMGGFTVGLGYETTDLIDVDGSGTVTAGDAEDVSHVVATVSAAFGDATVKALYGSADFDVTGGGSDDGDQWAISLDYVFGATTVTVFYTDDEELLGAEAYGIGVAYDLGGGAAIKAGYAQNETIDADGFELGITMSF